MKIKLTWIFFTLLIVSGCSSNTDWPDEGIFQGYYTSGFEISRFIPEETNESWWLSCSTKEAAERLRPPWGITSESLHETREPVFIIVKGTLSKPGSYGHLGAYKRELSVEEVIETRYTVENIKNALLINAVREGNIEDAQKALDEGADINAKDNLWGSPLMAASGKGYSKIVNLLIDNGADINAESEFGTTALKTAAQADRIEIVRLLLDRGADINAKGNFGETALMGAAEKGRTEVIRVLLERGADVNAKNRSGATALKMAKASGHVDIVKLLEEAGAKE